MAAPERTYRELLREPAGGGLAIALRRPAFVALVIGTGLSIGATGLLPARLLLSTIACWIFAPIVQTIAAAALVASSRQRAVGMARAIDLLFVGHGPWSLWLLVLAAGAAWGSGELVARATLVSAVAPILWTSWILRAFCKVVLNDSRRGILVRLALHQGIVWSFTAAYIIAAISWARLIPLLQR